MEELLYFFSTTQPRRPAVIRQVLLNKRTVSNLFWGLRYGILDWLATYPQLQREQFDAVIKTMLVKGWLIEEKQGLRLSLAGLNQSQAFEKKHYRITKPFLFSRLKTPLWHEVLQLLVQVVSETSYQNKQYYVVNSSMQARVIIKQWYQKYYCKNLGQQLGNQLLEFLKQMNSSDADLFMQLFSGHKVIAKTAEQLAYNSTYTGADIENLGRDLGSQLIDFLAKGTSIFKSLAQALLKQNLLAQSTLETYKLYQAGIPLARIGKMRNLKAGTVSEHLLEAAIFIPEFDFKRLLTPQDYVLFNKIFQGEIDNWRYEKIQQADPQSSFTKFRLYQIEQSKVELSR
ncbi:helix-turn-helix domain-containing protein [Liquorilactobacillus capillatus]|uniref:Helicase Helix-turn-helix domain-containing protein n=1 Tax=Liquorilactobacillus capillatus DSM 19910 TaxID=1423731 RepID=A0A0R1M033_9LACO|nr:helix-turn-helix domain-containing protein [Liquorilactobacillus capillatus]KRL01230.1 hypothetical protein FC81_GL001371 [Liquorilactobacillus capillatus DSM 19910]